MIVKAYTAEDFMSKIRAVDANLKAEQENAIVELLLGKDVLAVLPGFGKSRIFQVYSRVKDAEISG